MYYRRLCKPAWPLTFSFVAATASVPPPPRSSLSPSPHEKPLSVALAFFFAQFCSSICLSCAWRLEKEGAASLGTAVVGRFFVGMACQRSGVEASEHMFLNQAGRWMMGQSGGGCAFGACCVFVASPDNQLFWSLVG
ncbi:hypothetical protein IWZ00DRAFT_84647 [Phyllosticta capitalensis]